MNMLTAILLLSPLSPFCVALYKSPSPTSHVRFSLATGRRRLSMRVSPFSLLSSVACCVAVYSVYCAFYPDKCIPCVPTDLDTRIRRARVRVDCGVWSSAICGN